jgi:hypothetical protein
MWRIASLDNSTFIKGFLAYIPTVALTCLPVSAQTTSLNTVSEST